MPPDSPMKHDTKRSAWNPVTIVLIGLGVLFIVASRGLPAPRFDPLGAAPFPTALGWLIVMLGTGDLLRGAVRAWGDSSTEDEARVGAAGTARSAFILLLTVLYGISMALFGLNFAVATTAYLLAASSAFGRMTLRRSIVLLIFFPIFSLALDYLFKSVVYIDLP